MTRRILHPRRKFGDSLHTPLVTGLELPNDGYHLALLMVGREVASIRESEAAAVDDDSVAYCKQEHLASPPVQRYSLSAESRYDITI